jgi:hypothetical protein
MLTDSGAECMSEPLLEKMRTSIPAARSLPMLSRLARRESGRVVLDYLRHARLAVEVEPCS